MISINPIDGITTILILAVLLICVNLLSYVTSPKKTRFELEKEFEEKYGSCQKENIEKTEVIKLKEELHNKRINLKSLQINESFFDIIAIVLSAITVGLTLLTVFNVAPVGVAVYLSVLAIATIILAIIYVFLKLYCYRRSVEIDLEIDYIEKKISEFTGNTDPLIESLEKAMKQANEISNDIKNITVKFE